MRAVMVFASTAMLGAISPAIAYCSAPTAPSCATRYGAFDDQDDFDRCKRQISSYQSEANEFLACTKREADRVIEEYNSTVESFNRRARG